VIGWLRSWWEEHQANRVRNIPDSYFMGYRRLAQTRADVIGQRCWNCRHAVAFRNWWCGIEGPCDWECCHIADELTKADLKAGYTRMMWLGLPDASSIGTTEDPVERLDGKRHLMKKEQ